MPATVDPSARIRIDTTVGATVLVSDLATLQAPNGKHVMVVGYYAKGDCKPFEVYLDTGSSATANGGSVHTAPTGRWLASSFPVDASQWGVQQNPTDCTTRLQAAITGVAASGVGWRTLYMDGDYKFDPDSLTLPSGTGFLILSVNGKLRPQSENGITINDHFTIHGRGGGDYAVQFVKDASCDIVPYSANARSIYAVGAGGKTLKNIKINGGGVTSAAIYCYSVSGTLSAQLHMENVGVLVQADNATALLIDSVFWITIEKCQFLTTDNGNKSISIQSNDVELTGGLITFRDCITAGKGIEITGNSSNIEFQKHDHEGKTAGEHLFTIDGTDGPIFDLLFDQVYSHDELGGGKTFNFVTSNVQKVEVRRCGEITFNGTLRPYDSHIQNTTTYEYGTRKEMACNQMSTFNEFRGAVGARLLGRGMSANVCMGLTDEAYTYAPPTVPNNDMTAAYYLDGTQTAILYEPNNPTGIIDNVNTYFTGAKSWVAGDMMCAWVNIKYVDITSMIDPTYGIFRLGILSESVEAISNGGAASSCTPIGKEQEIQTDGWISCFLACKITGTIASGSPYLATSIKDNTTGMIMGPVTVCILRAANGWTHDSVIRLGQTMGYGTDAKAGVASLMSHQSFRTGKSATGSMSTAAAVGQASQYYDTTVDKPAWSTGSAWKYPAMLSSGKVPTSELGTGTASSSTYLRGDQTWQTISGSATWGGISGTLADQTDLQSALDAKAPKDTAVFTTSISNPGTGSNTERFGASATTGSSGNATAIGNSANAGAASATAVGHSSTAGATSVSIGASSSSTGNSVAVGKSAVVSGTGYAVSVGESANSSQIGATAIGYNASATGGYAFALGANVSVTEANWIRMGVGTTSSTAPSFSLSGKSSTTGSIDTFRAITTWIDATHATRKAKVVFQVMDTAAREYMAAEASGTAAKISFFGSTPVVKQAHIADVSSGTDTAYETAINAILSTLETYGLLATS